jgi:hypothetical protein
MFLVTLPGAEPARTQTYQADAQQTDDVTPSVANAISHYRT